MAYVYWLHLQEHNDYFKEGYIGVSKDPKRRLKEHYLLVGGGWHENPHLKHAFEKYKEKIIQTIIIQGPEEYCYEIESKLRNIKQIGWNIAEGGFGPPKMFGHTFNNGRKQSLEVIAKRVESLKEKCSKREGYKKREKLPKFGSEEYCENMRMKSKERWYSFSEEKRNEIAKKRGESQKGKSRPSSKLPWWTNGVNNRKQNECPGENWRKGRTTKKQEFSIEERQRRSERMKALMNRRTI